jgi:Co/Zn/Cd efflux system component
VEHEVRRVLEAEPGHHVADLHVWRVGPASRACIVSIVSAEPQPVEHYRERLGAIPSLHHVTVEVHRAGDAPGAASRG